MHSLLRPPPLALYIHYPWCVRKCPYCDFNSHQRRDESDSERYIDALIRDLEQELPQVWGRSVSSIFIGGGTPSLMAPQQLERLLAGVRARVRLTGQCEVTMEANPGTFEQERFAAFRQSGVNRLSLGIQSFNDQHLKELGRIHSSEDAITAIKQAVLAGFENLNLDLMYGLPGQTLDQAMADLHQAIDLKPQHISWYQLTIEPNTAFGSAPPLLPDEDVIWEQAAQGEQLLEENGYVRYEVSAYSKSGFQCRHNRNYWEFGDYIGIGAGAHGKVTRCDQQTINRRQKLKHPKAYLQGLQGKSQIEREDEITLTDRPIEFLLNGLRLKDGFDLALFEERTGLTSSDILPMIEAGQKQGLLKLEERRLATTSHGYRFLDSVLEIFM